MCRYVECKSGLMASLRSRKTSLAFDDRNQEYDCIQSASITFNLLGISMMRNAFITENRPSPALQNPGTQENSFPLWRILCHYWVTKAWAIQWGLILVPRMLLWNIQRPEPGPLSTLFAYWKCQRFISRYCISPYYVALNLINTQFLSVKLSSAGLCPTTSPIRFTEP